MNEQTVYQIVLNGRPSERLLRPLLDDFAATACVDGRVRLVGPVRDSAHLHGVVSHLTSVNVEIVLLAPLHDGEGLAADDVDEHPVSDFGPERSTS